MNAKEKQITFLQLKIVDVSPVFFDKIFLFDSGARTSFQTLRFIKKIYLKILKTILKNNNKQTNKQKLK